MDQPTMNQHPMIKIPPPTIPPRIDAAFGFLSYCRQVETPPWFGEAHNAPDGRKLNNHEHETLVVALRLLRGFMDGQTDPYLPGWEKPQEPRVAEQAAPRDERLANRIDGFMAEHRKRHAEHERLSFTSWEQGGSAYIQCAACGEVEH